MSGSPGEAIEAFGWAPTVAIVLSAVSALLAIGGSRQVLKGLETKVADLKAETEKDIEDARGAADKVAADLQSYKDVAREKFAIAKDLEELGRNLGTKIDKSHEETRRQVEELRTEIGRKNITHTINNAITAGMAQAVKEMKAREERA